MERDAVHGGIRESRQIDRSGDVPGQGEPERFGERDVIRRKGLAPAKNALARRLD
jgi:hypothetical protein